MRAATSRSLSDIYLSERKMPITISRLAGWLLDHLQNGWANSVYTYLDIVGSLRDNISLWDYYIIYYYYTIYYNYYNRRVMSSPVCGIKVYCILAKIHYPL